jgi:serine/threonine-protein kinase ULK/ATG1
VEYLADKMKKRENVFKLDLWDTFVDSKDFNDIFTYIEKEHDVFRLYFTTMLDKITANPKSLAGVDASVKSVVSSNTTQNIEPVLKTVLQDYSLALVQQIL